MFGVLILPPIFKISLLTVLKRILLTHVVIIAIWKAFYEFYVFLNLFHGKNVYANITRKICVKYM